jgi:hypothetical protein
MEKDRRPSYTVLTFLMGWCGIVGTLALVLPFGLPDEPAEKRITVGVYGAFLLAAAVWLQRVRHDSGGWKRKVALVIGAIMVALFVIASVLTFVLMLKGRN